LNFEKKKTAKSNPGAAGPQGVGRRSAGLRRVRGGTKIQPFKLGKRAIGKLREVGGRVG